jgi:hypothetical protein
MKILTGDKNSSFFIKTAIDEEKLFQTFRLGAKNFFA